MSSSDDSDLDKEAMAPDLVVGIQTPHLQPQVSGFSSVANPSRSIKDWAESLIELTEISGDLLPLTERNSSYLQQLPGASPRVYNTPVPPSHDSQPTPSRTVVTCAVVSSTAGSVVRPFSESELFTVLNELQESDAHGAQGSWKPSIDISNLQESVTFTQSYHVDSSESLQKINVHSLNIEPSVTAYIPPRDTCYKSPLVCSAPTVQALLPSVESAPSTEQNVHQNQLTLDIHQNPQCSITRTDTVFPQSHEPSISTKDSLPFPLQAQSTERDLSELRPTTVPIHNIDMLTIYDFDIDIDIPLVSEELKSTTLIRKAPVTETSQSHYITEAMRTSFQISSCNTLETSDLRISSKEGSFCSQTNLGFSPVSSSVQYRETVSSLITSQQPNITASTPHKPPSTDITSEKWQAMIPFPTDGPASSQPTTGVLIRSQKSHLTRSSSDPLTTHSRYASPPNQRLVPKFQHQFSLPFDTTYSSCEQSQRCSQPSINRASLTGPSHNFIKDVSFTESEETDMSSLYVPQTVASSSTKPYTYQGNMYVSPGRSASIYPTQAQDSAYPESPDLFLQSISMASSFQTDASDRSVTNLDEVNINQNPEMLPHAFDSLMQQPSRGVNLAPHASTKTTAETLTPSPDDLTSFHHEPVPPPSASIGNALKFLSQVTDDFPELTRVSPRTVSPMMESPSENISPSAKLILSTCCDTPCTLPSTESSSVPLPSSGDFTKSSSKQDLEFSEEFLPSTQSHNTLSLVSSEYSSISSETGTDNQNLEALLNPNACSTEPLRPVARSMPLTKLIPSTPPVDPVIKESLRTKLQGKGSKPPKAQDEPDFKLPQHPSVRRKSLKRSCKGCGESTPGKKRARMKGQAPEPKVCGTQSRDKSSLPACSIAQDPQPSTSQTVRTIL